MAIRTIFGGYFVQSTGIFERPKNVSINKKHKKKSKI